MTDINEWVGRVGESWASEWQRTDRSFAAVTERLLDDPAAHSLGAALDIGCGAGELACRLSERQPYKRVTGVDISADLLAVARSRCSGPIFVEADAANFTPEGPSPDFLVSRHGVMFFDDPTAAFANFARIAASGATLRFSCFRERAENEWALQLASILPQSPAPANPDAPGPFAFGRKSRVEGILTSAGWRGLEFEAIDYPMIAGEGPDAVAEALAYFRRIGPAARGLAELADAERTTSIERLRALLASKLEDNRVALPAACWIVTARAPA